MNKPKSKGMSPVVKGGLACCGLLGLLCVVSCLVLGFWAQGMVSVDGTAISKRVQSTTGGALPSGITGKFSVDSSPAPMFVHVATAADPMDLTLIAILWPPMEGESLPEHALLWEKCFGAIAPQMAAKGVTVKTANPLSISDTGDAEEADIEVDGKTFKATMVPCKMADGTELKRYYVKLAGEGNMKGVFGIGKAGDFDVDSFKAFLSGCTPR